MRKETEMRKTGKAEEKLDCKNQTFEIQLAKDRMNKFRNDIDNNLLYSYFIVLGGFEIGKSPPPLPTLLWHYHGRTQEPSNYN